MSPNTVESKLDVRYVLKQSGKIKKDTFYVAIISCNKHCIIILLYNREGDGLDTPKHPKHLKSVMKKKPENHFEVRYLAFFEDF